MTDAKDVASRFQSAAKVVDFAELKKIVETYPTSAYLLDNWYGVYRNSVLHLAAENDDADFIVFALSRRATKERQNAGEETPMHVAAANGSVNAIRALASRGAKVNPRDEGDDTPLEKAILHRKMDVVRVLAGELGAKIDNRDYRGRTTVYEAVLNEKVEVVKILLESCQSKKKVIDTPDRHGATALHAAIYARNAELVKMMVENGASLSARGLSVDIPLGEVLSLEETDNSVKIELIEALGIDLKDPKNAAQLVHFAAKYDLGDFLLYLTSHYGLDVTATRKGIGSPLVVAIEKSALSSLSVMLEAGASVETPLPNKNHPLHLALYEACVAAGPQYENDSLPSSSSSSSNEEDDGEESEDAITNEKSLSENDGPIKDLGLTCGNKRGTLTRRSYFRTTGRKRRREDGCHAVGTLRLLLSHGANTEALCPRRGCTPLHSAAEMGYMKGLRILCDHGADLTALTPKRKTVLGMASTAKAKAFVESEMGPSISEMSHLDNRSTKKRSRRPQ